MPELHKPMFVPYGPACTHDVPCPVWWDAGYHAVYEMNDGVFLPSWAAQDAGFVLLRVRWPRLRRLLQRWFPPKAYAGWPSRADWLRHARTLKKEDGKP